MNDRATIQQVGNIYPDTAEFKNKTSGRVYSPEGIAPTLNTAEGGGENTIHHRTKDWWLKYHATLTAMVALVA